MTGPGGQTLAQLKRHAIKVVQLVPSTFRASLAQDISHTSVGLEFRYRYQPCWAGANYNDRSTRCCWAECHVTLGLAKSNFEMGTAVAKTTPYTMRRTDCQHLDIHYLHISPA